MVGVRGDVGDQFGAHQLEREAGHLLAEVATKRRGGHRGKHALADQGGEHSGVASDRRTTLGVGEQHTMALIQERSYALPHVSLDVRRGRLDQQPRSATEP